MPFQTDSEANKKSVLDEMNVSVVFTNTEETFFALQYASHLFPERKGHITMLALQASTHFISSISSACLAEFAARYFMWIIATTKGIQIEITVCSVKRGELEKYLVPRSLVIIAGQKRWWPSKQERFAKSLLLSGYSVIFVPTPSHLSPC